LLRSPTPADHRASHRRRRQCWLHRSNQMRTKRMARLTDRLQNAIRRKSARNHCSPAPRTSLCRYLPKHQRLLRCEAIFLLLSCRLKRADGLLVPPPLRLIPSRGYDPSASIEQRAHAPGLFSASGQCAKCVTRSPRTTSRVAEVGWSALSKACDLVRQASAIRKLTTCARLPHAVQALDKHKD